ncbi:Protein RCC2 [Linum grandiflorum]
MSAAGPDKKVDDEGVDKKGGELLFCGATCWDGIGRKKGLQPGNLVSPTRLRPLVGIDIRFVASGCTSCHCVALDVDGRCYTWGRNEACHLSFNFLVLSLFVCSYSPCHKVFVCVSLVIKQKGQLGHGDTIQRDRPTVVSELSKYKIIRAGGGKNHTVVVTEDGESLAFGWNKNGQLGSGSVKNEIESSPVRCLVSDVKTTACGADFTVWLSSVEGATILTAGLPQYGQLGHGTDNEYNTKDSSVRLAYEAQPRPRAIAAFAKETVVKVACGANHTVAVDSNGYVYTLGHREQKDEWAPRRVDIFQRQNVLPPDAIISAGAVNSSCTAGGGQLYMWGKIKNTGDDWMYPKPLMDLSGWNIRCMDSGHMHHFVGADTSCISWGSAQYGELGYGPMGQKSSAIPKKVDTLEGMHVLDVACGLGHSMAIVDRAKIGDQLDQLDVYDGKDAAEEIEAPQTKKTPVKQNAKKKGAAAAKASDSAKKRKKSKDSSESEEEEASDKEDEEDDDEDESDESEGVANGKKGSKGKRGGKAGAGKGAGRGRGRPPAASKTANASQAKSGKRGRPRKS